MALRLGNLCGNGPEFWLRMQMLRDLWRPKRTLAADLDRHPDPPRRVIPSQLLERKTCGDLPPEPVLTPPWRPQSP
jgi:hypothetical protein